MTAHTPRIVQRHFDLLILFLLPIIFVLNHSAGAQHLIGSYTTSAPEASMFFLDPGYLSPAFGSGALGMHSNPAGLHVVKGTRLSFVYATAQSSASDFTFEPPLENDFYMPIRLDTRINIKESGGLGAVGFAHRTGNWVWGLTLMQPRTGGLMLQAQGSIDLTTQFELDTPITRDMVSDLPVDEIPVTWNVNTTGRLTFTSTPAEVSLSSQPMMAGFSMQKGAFSLGAGLTYYRFFSSNDIGQINTHLQADATVTGEPQGIDPFSNLPWNGRLVADLTIEDAPLTAQYQFNLSGHRLALSIGGMMNYKYLSLGLNYTNGFKSSLRGTYNITTITTVDLQDRDILSDVELDLTAQPELEGHASLALYNFKKDTTLSRDRGSFNIRGYHSISAGLHFLIFGLFGGVEIPKSYPDISSLSLGVYSDFPLYKLPVRFNIGFLTRTETIQNSINDSVPLRITSHVGAGLAFKLPLNDWFEIGEEPAWLRLGARSSLTPYVLDVFQSELEQLSKPHVDSIFKRTAWSFGLIIPY